VKAQDFKDFLICASGGGGAAGCIWEAVLAQSMYLEPLRKVHVVQRAKQLKDTGYYVTDLLILAPTALLLHCGRPVVTAQETLSNACPSSARRMKGIQGPLG
jgi:hypothetical protein